MAHDGCVDDTGRLDDTDELNRLRAERDALAQEVETLRTHRNGAVRKVAVGVLVVISWLALALAPVAVWARNTVMETDRWVAIAGPLAEEEAVQAALATWATDQLDALVQPQQILTDALPDRADVLAAPLASAITGFVRDKVLEYLRTDEFARLWANAVARAHELAMRVLEGDAPNVQATGDRVTINLVPLLQRVLDRITSASPELFGRTIDIPDIDLDDIPADAAQRLGAAVGVDVPDDFGQFTVYDDGKLQQAQDAIRLLSRGVYLIVALAVIAPVAAIWLSRRKLGTATLVAVGTLFGLVLVRRLLYVVDGMIVDKVRVPENVGAVERLLDRLLDPFFTATAWFVGGAAVLVVVLYLCSPRRGAVWVRGAVPRLGRRTLSAAEANRVVAQVVVVALGLIVLWTVDLGWLATLLLVGATAAATWAVGQLPEPADEPTDQPPDPPADVPATT